MVQLGDICSLMSKHKDAEHWYRGAIRVDESSFPALVGLARCQLNDSSSASEDLAKQQVDYLMGVQPNHPELLLMSAKLINSDPKLALENLNLAAMTLIQVCTPIRLKFLTLF